MWIMIAGPYRTGARSEAERDRNLEVLNGAAYSVFRKGHVPIVGVNLALPLIRAAGMDAYDSVMMPLSTALADRCDAVLRLDGVSAGADEETRRVRRRGGRVFAAPAEVPEAAEGREPGPDRTEKVNLADKLGRFTEHWSPRIVGELNGQHVKVAKLKGDFVWHRHEDADELFLVLAGRLVVQLRERDVALEPGEFFIVPKGVEHKPIAAEEVQVLLFEPAGTVNTGDVIDARTVADPERL